MKVDSNSRRTCTAILEAESENACDTLTRLLLRNLIDALLLEQLENLILQLVCRNIRHSRSSIREASEVEEDSGEPLGCFFNIFIFAHHLSRHGLGDLWWWRLRRPEAEA